MNIFARGLLVCLVSTLALACPQSARAFTCAEVKAWAALGYTEATAAKWGIKVTPAMRVEAAKCFTVTVTKPVKSHVKKTPHKVQVPTRPSTLLTVPPVTRTPDQAPTVPVVHPSLTGVSLMSVSVLLNVFAVIGVAAFAYLVYSKGLVPVTNSVVSWWNSGKADAAALEARVTSLENALGLAQSKGQSVSQPAVQAAPAGTVTKPATPVA